MTWGNRGRGFGLIEVLISLLLISMGTIGLLKAQAYMLKSSDHAKRSIDALYLAETQLEVFTTRSQEGLYGTIRYESIASGERNTQSGAHEFKLNWVVTPMDLQQANQGKLIDMSVLWIDRQGKEQSVKLRTFISAYSEFDSNTYTVHPTFYR